MCGQLLPSVIGLFMQLFVNSTVGGRQIVPFQLQPQTKTQKSANIHSCEYFVSTIWEVHTANIAKTSTSNTAFEHCICQSDSVNDLKWWFEHCVSTFFCSQTGYQQNIRFTLTTFTCQNIVLFDNFWCEFFFVQLLHFILLCEDDISLQETANTSLLSGENKTMAKKCSKSVKKWCLT